MKMAENVHRIRIESAYGKPGQRGWAYHAIDESNGSIILEGEVERKGEMYHMLLRPQSGGREELEGDVKDPHAADSKLQTILKLRAEVLVSETN